MHGMPSIGQGEQTGLNGCATFEERVREVERIVQRQNEWRQIRTLNLIASENILSRRARVLLSSDFTHRYAEGHPGARYYQGTQYIDSVESEVKDRLRELFGVQRVEVRTISGTNANEVVFSSLVKGNEPVLANSLSAGGHISHQLMGGLGKYTRNILFFPRLSDGYRIDSEKAKDLIWKEKPKLAVFGKSLILFPEPVRELASVCREAGVTMLYDGAHVLGLIAGKRFQDPLAEGCDIVMGSTHKTFFGPQRGVILSNSDEPAWTRIDKAAFPGSTSNHHLNTLPPLLVSTYEMLEFGRAYAEQVVKNAQALALALHKRGFAVECADLGYTESHQVSVNVKSFGGGGKVSEILKENDVITNRNLLPADPKTFVNNPSGIRLGTQEMTRVGMKEPEMETIAQFFKEVVIDGKSVKIEVNRFRAGFSHVHFSSDLSSDRGEVAPAGPSVDVDLAGY